MRLWSIKDRLHVTQKPANMNRKSKGPAAQMRAKATVRKAKRSASKRVHSKTSREKVQAYRERMRAKGFRLVQLWLPDTRTPEFAAEAHRQSLRANQSPSAAEDQAWADSIADRNFD